MMASSQMESQSNFVANFQIIFFFFTGTSKFPNSEKLTKIKSTLSIEQ